MARYGQAFKNRAVARLLPPESAPLLAEVAHAVGVSADTLERWRNDALGLHNMEVKEIVQREVEFKSLVRGIFGFLVTEFGFGHATDESGKWSHILVFRHPETCQEVRVTNAFHGYDYGFDVSVSTARFGRLFRKMVYFRLKEKQDSGFSFVLESAKELQSALRNSSDDVLMRIEGTVQRRGKSANPIYSISVWLGYRKHLYFPDAYFPVVNDADGDVPIEVEVDGQPHTFVLNPGFWKTWCSEIRDRGNLVIREWLQRHYTLNWSRGKAPQVQLIPLGEYRFRLLPAEDSSVEVSS